jgi:hypothetical protein
MFESYLLSVAILSFIAGEGNRAGFARQAGFTSLVQ